MKLVRGLLMSLVGAIILIHTLVPHEHFDDALEVASLHSHECTSNLLLDIQISFGVDHGFGHFEHFVDNDQVDDQFTLACEVVPFGSSTSQIGSTAIHNETFLAVEVLTERLRGPPQS